MTVKEREKAYKEAQAERKAKIKAEPNKHKRFWKWIWFIIIFPFEWIWVNIRDWHDVLEEFSNDIHELADKIIQMRNTARKEQPNEKK